MVSTPAFAGGKKKPDTDRQKELQNAWEQCVVDFAIAVAPSNPDTSQAVAQGALVTCQDKEDALYKFFTKKDDPIINDFVNKHLFPAIKEYYFKKAAAAAMMIRSGKKPKIGPPAERL